MGIIDIRELKNTTGKLLGVDFGDVRTGIAACDTSRFLASGISVINPGGIEKTAQAIAEIAAEQKVCAIVIGLPVNMDGSEGSRAQRCRKLAALIGEISDIPTLLFDERMTTMTAARYLNETNTRGKKRKQVIDALSAQIILQNCLDRLKNL